MTDQTERPMHIAVMGGRGVPSNYSGIESICENLFSIFASRGHKVTVYCRPSVMQNAMDIYKGIHLVRTPAPGGLKGETLSHTYFSLRHAIKKGDVHSGGTPFDLLSFHSIAPNFWAKMARKSGIPLISHVHGLDHQREKWKGLGAKIIRRAERAMVKHATRVVTVNKSIVDYYRNEFNLDAALLPNGIHMVSDDFSPDQKTLDQFGLEPGKFIVSIGRLVPEKRLHDTLTAFAGVDAKMKFAVVGQGVEGSDYLSQLYAQGKADPRVVFTGLQKGAALETLFRSAAAYVSASELEGLPSSVLEAMERKVPVILSDIPPHVELAGQVQGYDLFFKPGDVPAIQDRINRVLHEPAHFAGIAQRAREFVRTNYAWPVLAERTEQLYRQVLNQSRR